MINIMEDEAAPVKILERFFEANIDQCSPVKAVAVCLVDNVYLVVNILPDKEGVDMAEKDWQLPRPGSVRNYQGNIRIFRDIFTTLCYRIFMSVIVPRFTVRWRHC